MPALGETVSRIKRLPGIRAVVAVQQRYGEEGGGMLASAITYHAFFSLFPLLLVGLAVLGFVFDDPARQRALIRDLTETVPGLAPMIGDNIDALVAAREAAGVLGVLGFIWTGSLIVRAAGRSMSQVFRIDIEGDNPIKQLLWAFGSLATLGVIAAVALGMSFLGSSLPGGNAGWSILLIAVGLVADVGLFLVAYRVLTRGGGPTFRALLPGATFAAIGWTVLKLIGSWYARRTVAGASEVYGSFAAAIGMLVMLSFGARLFVYGAVLNVVRMRRHPELMTEAMEIEEAGAVLRR